MSKIILITGTSSGFGKLSTITLAKEGHTVIAAMREVNGKNSESAKELSALPNVDVVEMDVTSEESVNAAVQIVLKKYNKIDILINNAGVTGFGLLEATSINQIKKIFEVNLFGAIRTYQAVLPSMREEKSGLIINISSGLGLFAPPFIVPYEMTKFGLEALTEGIRYEIKGYGIETVTVQPGPFPTEIGDKAAGFGPDRQDILDSYGPTAQSALEGFGTAMYGKMTEYQADSQEIADALLKLINLPSGTRPFHTVVNRLGEGVEQAFVENRKEYRKGLMDNMGWGEF
ncbi:SDR family oxidoreductase [Dyadobacter subterraneus]|uniref:SDR family oxidoreductase n=1 Tax=Dyadobacter subterraneus TaxID=2773304 RepID=A0ABR9WM95_9BACT|nr:SDR family oxidoreductase [Dyadobacter subterraneus]MBE9466643.1 SDR family oxidoreductase [Dyadobacter subterraneus]